MPAYRVEEYIEQAIASVLEQEVPLELIVVDDASPDKTAERILRAKALFEEKNEERNHINHKELVFLRNQTNLGAAASRNLAVSQARGSYVAFLDADDWWRTDKLARQVAYLEREGLDFCYTARELVRADGSSTGKIIHVPETTDYQKLLRTNVIPCGSVLLKTSLAKAHPMGHDQLHEDYLLWLTLLKEGCKAGGIDEPMLKCRQSPGGKSRDKLHSAKMQYGVYRLLGLSVPASLGYMVSYAFHGVSKYAPSNEKWDNFRRTMRLKQTATQTNPNVWIFSSTDNRHFNYNSRYLFLYVLEHEPDICPVYVMNDDTKRAKMEEQYGKEHVTDSLTDEGISRILRAGVWVTSAGLPAYGTGLSKGRLIINLWHGIPLKRIVLLETRVSALKRLYFRSVFSDNYTHVLATSKELAPIMEQSFGVSENKIRIWGQPRCDCLWEQPQDDLRVRWGLDQTEKLILYAPTFRDHEPVRLFPFEDYDKERLEAFLQKEHLTIALRTHIKETADVGAYTGGRVRLFNEEQVEDVMEYLNQFDALITDYSSIFLDFLLLDRPLIFLDYDRETYFQQRGFLFDYDEVTPGIFPASLVEFMDGLHRIFSGEPSKDPFAAKRKAVRQRMDENSYPSCPVIVREIREELEKKG
jgi:CDP-glycerol glycerophosphotransferase